MLTNRIGTIDFFLVSPMSRKHELVLQEQVSTMNDNWFVAFFFSLFRVQIGARMDLLPRERSMRAVRLLFSFPSTDACLIFRLAPNLYLNLRMMDRTCGQEQTNDD